MLDHINSLEQLEAEAQMIDDFVTVTSPDNPEACITRGNELASYMARTGKMLADAQYHRDTAKKAAYMEILAVNAGVAPSIMKEMANAATTRENALYIWIDRLNRTCTHQIDWLRTVVSRAKKEQERAGGVSGQKYTPPEKDDNVPF